MDEDIIVMLKRSNDLLMTFGNDYSDVFLPAIDEIVRLREALRLAGDRVEPLASFQQKDIGSSTIRVGEETKFSRDARSFNGEK